MYKEKIIAVTENYKKKKTKFTKHPCSSNLVSLFARNGKLLI